MIKIGLTGGIGSGKSIVARIFEILGAPVYHADLEAKRLMNQYPDLIKKITELLGHSAYIEGRLDSRYVASMVFNDPEMLEKLNQLVHPAVRIDFENWALQHSHSAYIMEEAAILFESGHFKYFDFNLLVSADEELRIKRVMLRDSVTRDSVVSRMKQQMPDSEKLKKSDFVIYNNENDLILEKVINLHNKFISLHNKK
jgi:dephospho-CoA kinase